MNMYKLPPADPHLRQYVEFKTCECGEAWTLPHRLGLSGIGKTAGTHRDNMERAEWMLRASGFVVVERP